MRERSSQLGKDVVVSLIHDRNRKNWMDISDIGWKLSGKKTVLSSGIFRSLLGSSKMIL
jgi:hypothetical protein